jgi:hypothetical protein
MRSPEEVVAEANGRKKPLKSMSGNMGGNGGGEKKGSQIELPIDDDSLFRLFMLTTIIANALIIFKSR